MLKISVISTMQSSVKIIVIDYYMEAPKPGLDAAYSEFRCSSISQVPVLRCFGSTDDGKKAHNHKYCSYMYYCKIYMGKGNN